MGWVQAPLGEPAVLPVNKSRPAAPAAV